MPDNRQHPRRAVSLTVRYASRGDLQRDLVTNISPGGVFVRTAEPLPIGTDISLEFVMQPNSVTFSVEGKVTWLGDQRGPGGMGIQFTGVLGPVLAEMVEQARQDSSAAP